MCFFSAYLFCRSSNYKLICFVRCCCWCCRRGRKVALPQSGILRHTNLCQPAWLAVRLTLAATPRPAWMLAKTMLSVSKCAGAQLPRPYCIEMNAIERLSLSIYSTIGRLKIVWYSHLMCDLFPEINTWLCSNFVHCHTAAVPVTFTDIQA